MATINDFGIPGVGNTILQPKLKNKWKVTFANLGGGIDSQPVSLQAVSIERPKLSFAEVELHRYNSRAYVAGKHEFDSITLTLEDDITGEASKVLQEQLQKQQWLIGAEGQWLASASSGELYKFVTYMEQLDGNEQVVERWTMEGCWFRRVDYQDNDYSTSDQIQITVEIRFDLARQSLFGLNDSEGVALGGAGK